VRGGGPLAHNVGMGKRAPIAVQRRRPCAQLHFFPGQDGLERGPRGASCLRARAGLAGIGRERRFDTRKTNCASIVEREAAAVEHVSHRSAAKTLDPAAGIAWGARLRRGARCRQEQRDSKGQKAHELSHSQARNGRNRARARRAVGRPPTLPFPSWIGHRGRLNGPPYISVSARQTIATSACGVKGLGSQPSGEAGSARARMRAS
jgi:hypothetical protein